MKFPLSITDISLWLAITAIMLLITSELLSSSIEPLESIAIDKKKLRLAALALGLSFMGTVIMRIFY
ncbi:MAG TPA: hypothetical protein VMS94_02305 [Acidobacteriota bacterium]|nr:hypothetical protein [Acidobacteriota bacterium]